MKMHLLLALAGLAFTGPALAQQKDTITDPQIVQQLHAIGMKSDEAFKKGDAAARAALFAEDAILVTYTGPVYGREAIEKYYEEQFKKVHFIDQLTTYDPNSPHPIGTDGKAVLENGEWKATIQGQTGGPIQLKGNWASVKVREGDDWRIRLTINNVTPAPAATGTATPSPTATPSK
jgi:uncharacterized protein (TIGR02246 family)